MRSCRSLTNTNLVQVNDESVRWLAMLLMRGFNTSLVQVKGYLSMSRVVRIISFNTSLVQVKGRFEASGRAARIRFNTSLVQVKVFYSHRNAMPYIGFNTSLVQVKAARCRRTRGGRLVVSIPAWFK